MMDSSFLFWRDSNYTPAFRKKDILNVIERIREPVYILQNPNDGSIGLGLQGEIVPASQKTPSDWPLLAILPPLYPEWLGDRSFGEAHGVRFPYVSGAMANGIATTRLVIAMAKAGGLGFFGAAGLSLRTYVYLCISSIGDGDGDA